MPPRRPGAPRLIEWTGERLVPWAHDAQVAYEHFHRYLWAQPLVADRRVLDLASGEGFGSALLADSARSVTGVDIDEQTVEHSRQNYAAPNLEFRVASATDLSAFEDGAFDAVVAFEMIEHVADQDAVVAEVARVLAPDGLLVISTPERQAYSDDREFVNPFHARELSRDEFTALLHSRFGAIALFAQRTAAGSRIEALEPPANGGHLAVRIEWSDGEWRPAGPPAPLYLVAVAAPASLPELAAESTLSDFGVELIAEHEERRAQLEREFLAERQRLIAELGERARESAEAHARAQRAEDELAEMRRSVSWQLVDRARRALDRFVPPGSPPRRALSALLVRVGRHLG
jgi:SAM-dependent methyltransferase